MIRAALFLLLAGPALAVQPDEVLDDPVLEARARALSSELRCVVCRSESIDESNADIARDLRLLVRERLVAGDSDEEVLSFLTDRYGEYVLLRPTTRGANVLLWIAGPALLVAGGVIAIVANRRSANEGRGEQLDADEEARLKSLLGGEN